MFSQTASIQGHQGLVNPALLSSAKVPHLDFVHGTKGQVSRETGRSGRQEMLNPPPPATSQKSSTDLSATTA